MTKKRKLFNELIESVDAMQQQRKGKITLRLMKLKTFRRWKWMQT